MVFDLIEDMISTEVCLCVHVCCVSPVFQMIALTDMPAVIRVALELVMCNHLAYEFRDNILGLATSIVGQYAKNISSDHVLLGVFVRVCLLWLWLCVLTCVCVGVVFRGHVRLRVAASDRQKRGSRCLSVRAPLCVLFADCVVLERAKRHHAAWAPLYASLSLSVCSSVSSLLFV